jgi:cell division septum initiation protein DivIVA
MQKNDGNRSNGNNNSNADSNNEEVFRIGDRSFRKIKLGLAEEEVRAYVEELINQRDALLKRQEHLAALTELAEKTVMDASNLSQAMTKKAADQAKAEGDKMRARAEQETDQYVKARKAEAKAVADKESEAIKAEADRQARLIREQHLDGIRAEAVSLSQKLQNDLIANIENMKKSIATIGKNFKPMESSADTSSVNVSENKDKSAVLSDREKGVLLDHVPWLEIEIMPPMDIEKIMDLISHLEKLPEVKTTDLLPETPNPLIRVFLSKPLALANMLRTLPQISQVTELFDSNSVDSETGEKRERIQVTFGTNSGKNQQSKKDSSMRN